jgi:hypothetical protein
VGGSSDRARERANRAEATTLVTTSPGRAQRAAGGERGPSPELRTREPRSLRSAALALRRRRLLVSSGFSAPGAEARVYK